MTVVDIFLFAAFAELLDNSLDEVLSFSVSAMFRRLDSTGSMRELS